MTVFLVAVDQFVYRFVVLLTPYLQKTHGAIRLAKSAQIRHKIKTVRKIPKFRRLVHGTFTA